MEANAGNNSNCSDDEGLQQQLPLAMFAVERNSNKRLLFDVTTRNIRGVSSYIFPDATCAFENNGWLLMIRHKPCRFQEQTVFLVHPSSGKQLKNLPVFPCLEERQGYPGFFVFYVGSHGLPLVVARFEIWSIVPTVHIACPGDTYWSVYKHGAEPEALPYLSRTKRWSLERICIADLALLGMEVVCVDDSGQILVFDITEMTWERRRRTAMAPPCPEWSQEKNRHFYLVASQSHGEVVLVSRSRPGTMEDGFEFFRLDMEAMEWSKMDGRELDDTSWFFRTGQSFRVKDAGRRRVYTFSGPKPMDSSCQQTTNGVAMSSSTACFTRTTGTSGHDQWLKSITNVYAYDLDDGTVEMVIPASLVTEARRWIQPSMFATIAK